MNVALFKNGIIYNICGYDFNVSYYNHNEQDILITGIMSCESLDNYNRIKQNINHIVSSELYFIDYDSFTNEIYFILKDYHSFIKKFHIDILMFDYEDIDNIYLEVFIDYLCYIFKYKIDIIIKKSRDEVLVVFNQDDNYKLILTNYIDLLTSKRLNIFARFLNKIKSFARYNKVQNVFTEV